MVSKMTDNPAPQKNDGDPKAEPKNLPSAQANQKKAFGVKTLYTRCPLFSIAVVLMWAILSLFAVETSVLGVGGILQHGTKAKVDRLAETDLVYANFYILQSRILSGRLFETHNECLIRAIGYGHASYNGLPYQLYPHVVSQTIMWAENNCARLMFSPQVRTEPFFQRALMTIGHKAARAFQWIKSQIGSTLFSTQKTGSAGSQPVNIGQSSGPTSKQLPRHFSLKCGIGPMCNLSHKNSGSETLVLETRSEWVESISKVKWGYFWYTWGVFSKVQLILLYFQVFLWSCEVAVLATWLVTSGSTHITTSLESPCTQRARISRVWKLLGAQTACTLLRYHLLWPNPGKMISENLSPVELYYITIAGLVALCFLQSKHPYNEQIDQVLNSLFHSYQNGLRSRPTVKDKKPPTLKHDRPPSPSRVLDKSKYEALLNTSLQEDIERERQAMHREQAAMPDNGSHVDSPAESVSAKDVEIIGQGLEDCLKTDPETSSEMSSETSWDWAPIDLEK